MLTVCLLALGVRCWAILRGRGRPDAGFIAGASFFREPSSEATSEPLLRFLGLRIRTGGS